MASFDLDQPSDDVDTEFARRLVRASIRTRAEMPVLWADPDTSEGDLVQASELIGQRIQRRPRSA
jgi:hypothetical protein